MPDGLKKKIRFLVKLGGLEKSPQLRRLSKYINTYVDMNTIYIHIPKVAGCSIHNSIYGVDPFGHFTIADFKKVFPRRLWPDAFKFSFVRNPFDRTLSAYEYLCCGGRKLWKDKSYQATLSQFSDFEDFVVRWLACEDIYSIEHFKPQAGYICSRSNDIQLDFLGRFENIEHDFSTLCELLGINTELLVHNVTQTRGSEDYRTRYTTEMRHIVEKRYERDLEVFGYEF